MASPSLLVPVPLSLWYLQYPLKGGNNPTQNTVAALRNPFVGHLLVLGSHVGLFMLLFTGCFFFDLRMTRHYNMPILSSLNDGQTLSLSWPRTALILLSEAVRTRIALRADVGRCDDAAVKTTRDTRNLWELIIPSKRCCARLPGFKLLSTICGIQ